MNLCERLNNHSASYYWKKIAGVISRSSEHAEQPSLASECHCLLKTEH